MASIFSKIIVGEIPCHKIYEDENHLAFLDVMPLVRGHVLVVPKREIDYIFDFSEDEMANMWKFALPVAKAIKKAIPCKRIGTAVIGLEVPHAHIHLVPMDTANDLNFTREKLIVSNEELAEIADIIRNCI
jgi:histidine triad (HIT) family protein